ncbi:alpha-glucan phosphorylase [Chloroherpeton thalassium ATCC 35110]|uniref:Alpha-glucan phosphorylase n=1 Tax=Chloroherpeton thalassium (strain ATCC 35110 / GB-78) TaxID=517418 RepID=B3QT19_CHLT3|nr:alpha-glucan family phosphorylase [Chloroherpeton thalassium]ACF12662.1 alpha-glucan phosphorylase [Chloroherpeton thalassium ATCC 35110]
MSSSLSKQTSNNTQSIPEQIALLKKLSKNLWWSWNADAQNVFSELSPRLWSKYNHSPIKVMQNVSEAELAATLSEKDYAEKVQSVLARFEEYLSEKNTWAATHADEFTANPVAYFSAEFGLHESLPIYSGGLGILAGDHIKSASDLGLNFIGVTLYYREGYFQQHLSMDGWQQEEYPLHPASTLPLEPVLDDAGKPVTVAIELAHSIVHVCAWTIKVGRAKLYLLDTNLEENEEHYRDITCHVYGGDATTRINQEIVLGIGGTRFLHKLGIKPAVYHMNEGHSGFLTLELLRRELDCGKSLDDAIAAVKPQCVFTTHTPVPAGHDRFSRDLMDYSLGKFAETMKIDFDTLMRLGKEHHNEPQNQFTMTVLCLNMSRAANGVSELNGVVAREMWQHLFQKENPNDVPIGHITNGVHTKTWMRDRTEAFWSFYTNNEQDFFSDPEHLAEILERIPDDSLWGLRYRLKRDLIEFVRYRLERQMSRTGMDNGFWASDFLSTDVLTIGFARRFATYKRAPLIFSDIDRIAAILSNSEKPVQIIFSGKAHPRDNEGKKFIQRIFQISRMPQFMGKVVFLENYDMNVARYLISGVDLWLNNPLRPLEASGTSGEKVIAHGGLNCSILDGWWREGYNGQNGWAIGKDENQPSTHEQSELDAKMLYEILETDIVPTYYARDSRNLPTEWIKKMRASILSLLPVYNTHRMVRDYCEKYYKSGKNA